MHRVALAALLLPACSDGIVPRAAPTPAPAAAPAVTPAAPTAQAPRSAAPRRARRRPAPSPTGLHVVRHVDPARGDVDGDGRADTATVVETGPRGDFHWRFGVRLAMTSAGTRIAWAEEGMGGIDGQQLRAVVDVNGDGRAEVVVGVGTSGSAAYYQLVTFTGGRPRFVPRSWLAVGVPDGHFHGWGCRDGLLYTTVTRRASGTVTWDRLVGTRLVRVRSETRRWRAGTKPPAPFGEPSIDCGGVT